MLSQFIFSIVLALFVNATDLSSYKCNECFTNSGKYCLNDNDYTKGSCFDPYDAATA